MNLILKLFSFKTISDTCFSWLFRITVLDDYFGCLFQMPISDDFSRWLPDASEWLSDYCSRWIFRMLASNDFSGWLLVIPRLILILAANPYFHGRFLFQPIIRLIGPTADLFLNGGFLLQNYGPDPPWY